MDHYIGVDFHTQESTVTVMQQDGTIMDERKLYHRDLAGIDRFFSQFAPGTPVAIEATRNWYWFVDFLQGKGLAPHLVHAKKARIIAESTVKTDVLSSRILAHLDRCNFLPSAYIADQKTRSARELLRYHMSLVRIRTSVKNKIHAILAKNNVQHSFSDLFGTAGSAFLMSLELSEVFRHELTGYLKLLDALKERINEVASEIRSLCAETPSTDRLRTIPGIAYFSALLLHAEIADIARFRSPKKLLAYAGLASRIHQSADTVHHGPLIKDSNKYIRYVLIEAVPFAVRKDPKLFAFYAKIRSKKGHNKAKVATAAKLLRAVYYMLKTNSDYRIDDRRNNAFQVNPTTKLGALHTQAR